MATAGAVPLLSFEEIAKFLNELQIAVSIEELKESKPETMLNIYDAFWREFDESASSRQQVAFQEIAFMDDPDLHRNSFLLIRMQLCLQKILKNYCRVDFKMNDIVSPNPKRTRKIMTSLQNYYLFWASKLVQIQELRVKQKELAAITEERVRQKSEVDIITNQKLETIQSIKQYCSGEEMKALDLECGVLQEGSKKIKEKYADLKDSIGNLKVAVSEKEVQRRCLQEKKQELQQKIVQSPDRVEAECQSINEQIEAKIAEQKSCRDRLNAIGTSCLTLQDVGNDVDEFLEQIAASIETAKEIQDKKQQNLELEKLIQTLNEKLKEMPSKLEHSSRMIHLRRKIFNKEHLHLEREKESLEIQYQEQEMKFQEMRKTRAKSMHERDITFEKREELLREIEKTKAATEKMMSEKAEEMCQIELQEKKYFEKVRKQAEELEKLNREFHPEFDK